jgi:hypothetical protein
MAAPAAVQRKAGQSSLPATETKFDEGGRNAKNLGESLA